MFYLSVVGALNVSKDAKIIATGGDAYRAPLQGGNGGAGSGGGILIQVSGQAIFEGDGSDGALISVLGGEANQNPPGFPYPPNNELSAGAGGNGRIRIETPMGFLLPGELNFEPLPTFGEFLESETARSTARSLPYSTLLGGAVRTLAPQFSEESILFAPQPPPAGSSALVIFEGAGFSLDVPGTPGEFFGGVIDPSLLEEAEFIRMNWFLFSNPATGPAAVDLILLPFDL